MRALILLAGLALCGLAAPVLAQTAEPRPRAAVVVVTLDEARQGQIRYGRDLLAILGDERFGRFDWVEPTLPLDDFRECEDESPAYSLARCARFYLRRAGTPDAPPHVVVVFADRRPGASTERDDGDMRALCFGRGAAAADAKAQDIWLWTRAPLVHGVRDWDRDQAALAGCIEAAMAEPPGEPESGSL